MSGFIEKKESEKNVAVLDAWVPERVNRGRSLFIQIFIYYSETCPSDRIIVKVDSSHHSREANYIIPSLAIQTLDIISMQSKHKAKTNQEAGTLHSVTFCFGWQFGNGLAARAALKNWSTMHSTLVDAKGERTFES